MSEILDVAKPESHSVSDKKPSPAPQGPERMATRAVYSPAIDIYENAQAITLLADLPGVDRSDVDITLEKSILTLRAHGKAKPPEGVSLIYAEYELGDFERSFLVSDDIDRDAITASVKNGLLTLTLPKRAPDKRSITISD
ncbi:MAG: Hsp20/alpha crystallin family protein [Planctomycetota bacterium]|jgi:HSP20 family molecular chaperone IbpA|nr:Hsp20/alpha crystallin family protein [Planctomycetota bacterium]